MVVGKPECEIGSRTAVTEGRIALFVQAGGAALENGIVGLPCGDGIGYVDAGGRKDQIP